MTSHTQCETEQTVLDLAYSLRSVDVEKRHRSKKMNIVWPESLFFQSPFFFRQQKCLKKRNKTILHSECLIRCGVVRSKSFRIPHTVLVCYFRQLSSYKGGDNVYWLSLVSNPCSTQNTIHFEYIFCHLKKKPLQTTKKFTR